MTTTTLDHFLFSITAISIIVLIAHDHDYRFWKSTWSPWNKIWKLSLISSIGISWLGGLWITTNPEYVRDYTSILFLVGVLLNAIGLLTLITVSVSGKKNDWANPGTKRQRLIIGVSLVLGMVLVIGSSILRRQ